MSCKSCGSRDKLSQMQALNRTQPIFPLAPGVPKRTTTFGSLCGMLREGGHSINGFDLR